MKNIYILILFIAFTACSTTKHLPADDYLYTGMKLEVVGNKEAKSINDDALEEINAALTIAPNNAIFGSGSKRWPIPFGLWMYNLLYKYNKGPLGWIKKKIAAEPVLLSYVNVDVRAKTSTNLLHDYGFLRGSVTAKEVKKKRKCKVHYIIDLGHPFIIDSIQYTGFQKDIDSLINANPKDKFIEKGQLFSIMNLGNERNRIVDILRNKGYYYFRNDYITFEADTVNSPGKIMLRIFPRKDVSKAVYKKWYPGKRSISITSENMPAGMPMDSTIYKDITIYHLGKLVVKPSILYNNFRLMPNKTYSVSREERTMSRFARLNVFRSTNISYTPVTDSKKNLLDIQLNAVTEQRYSSELNFDFVSKSNDQLGPGTTFTLSKRNIFKGGELLSLTLKGSYEWQKTGSTKTYNNGDKSLLNSWEMGTTLSLTIPRLLLPHESEKERRGTPSTSFELSFDRLNRAHYFRMISLNSDMNYNFQPSKYKQYTITPLSLTFNLLRAKTATFDSIMNANPGLSLSLSNKFIPAMKFAYTYDNATDQTKRNHIWWNTTFKSAGNIVSLGYKALGKSFNEEKQIFNNPFAQFLKFTSELRYNMKISRSASLVTRFFGGIICSYGNSDVAPYSEQFYIGGSNSLRAFTIRSIGPGKYKPDESYTYSYMDQTGDLKLEANVEYRFKIAGSLWGALFTDMGNIWGLREDSSRPGSRINFNRLPSDLALDTGFGLRYDFSYLVLRIDAGYALHVPYDTETNGYFNMRSSFKDAVGIHFAIGYPF